MSAARAALVTGGSSGIGAAVVRRLRERGDRVVVADLQDPGDGQPFIACDVTQPESLEAAVAFTEAQFGRLDLIFLNAGIAAGKAFPDMTPAEARRILAIDLDAVVLGALAAIPALRRAGGGSIIATSSLGGLVPVPGDPVYTAAKHGVIGFVRSLAVELGSEGMHLAALCPGFVRTPLIKDFEKGFDDAGFPLLTPEQAADGFFAALEGPSGAAWVVQPGREPLPFRFPNVPGARGGKTADVAATHVGELSG